MLPHSDKKLNFGRGPNKLNRYILKDTGLECVVAPHGGELKTLCGTDGPTES
jgi:NAD(P)H-hydrate repair Nnr-like enzyme with NAD(P)H-hydrate dehydratase domain